MKQIAAPGRGVERYSEGKYQRAQPGGEAQT
jgi:hypothetical protein